MSDRRAPSALVGRDQELEAIGRAVDAAMAGDTATLVIAGEAGIGKSRLIGALRDSAEERGGLAFVGYTPIAGSSGLPYAAFVDALRTLPRVAGAQLDLLVGPSRRDLERMAPWLSTDRDEDPSAFGDGSDGTRLRTFEAVAALLERTAEWRPPVVLALEDLHWADRSTLDLLAYIVRVLPASRLVIAATVRTDDPAGPNEAVTRILGEIERDGRVAVIRPAALGAAEVAALASEGGRGSLSREQVEALLRRSDGNPFYAQELLLSGGMDEAVPVRLQDIVLGRLAGLPDPVRRLLRVAAVAGPRFEHALLRNATDAEPDFVDEALREGAARSVLGSATGPWGMGFVFRHELVREALEAELLPDEWVEAHRRLAAALLGGAVPRVAPEAIAARIAQHWLAAGDEAKALPALVRAARGSEASGGYPEAAERYRTAIEIWDRLALEEADLTPEAGIDRAELLIRAAEVSSLAGDVSDAIRYGRAVVDLVDPAGQPWPAALAQARLARFLSRAERSEEALSAYAAAAGAIDAAVEGSAAPDDFEAHRARVLSAYSRALLGAGRADEALPLARRALASALTAADRAEESHARTSLGLVLLATGVRDEAMAELASARRLLVESSVHDARPRPSRILSLVANYADLASGLAEESTGDDAARAATELARRLGVDGAAAMPLVAQQVRRAFNSGDWDEADRLAREAGTRSGEPSSATVAILATRARIATARSMLAEAANYLEGAFALGDHGELAAEVPLYWIALAELAIAGGRLDDALRAVDAGLATRPEQHGDAEGALELLALGARIEAERRERARVARDSASSKAATDAAESLHAQTMLLAEQATAAGSTPGAFLAQVEAETGRAAGRSDPRKWNVVAERWEQAGRPWPAAYARWQMAEALSSTRGGRERLREILLPALETARRLGALRLEDEIEALARRSRTTLERDTVTGGTAAAKAASEVVGGRLGLSERELEVLALVAEGRTNRQIATELFITEKTAGHHVSNVLGKLGASSRTEAAAIAHRAGVLPGERAAADSRAAD